MCFAPKTPTPPQKELSFRLDLSNNTKSANEVHSLLATQMDPTMTDKTEEEKKKKSKGKVMVDISSRAEFTHS